MFKYPTATIYLGCFFPFLGLGTIKSSKKRAPTNCFVIKILLTSSGVWLPIDSTWSREPGCMSARSINFLVPVNFFPGALSLSSNGLGFSFKVSRSTSLMVLETMFETATPPAMTINNYVCKQTENTSPKNIRYFQIYIQQSRSDNQVSNTLKLAVLRINFIKANNQNIDLHIRNCTSQGWHFKMEHHIKVH